MVVLLVQNMYFPTEQLTDYIIARPERSVTTASQKYIIGTVEFGNSRQGNARHDAMPVCIRRG